jgi:hypothetical protein
MAGRLWLRSTSPSVRVCAGQAGDAAAARDQLTALTPAVERVLGPEHPDTLSSRYGLAWWTGEAKAAGYY